MWLLFLRLETLTFDFFWKKNYKFFKQNPIIFVHFLKQKVDYIPKFRYLSVPFCILIARVFYIFVLYFLSLKKFLKKKFIFFLKKKLTAIKNYWVTGYRKKNKAYLFCLIYINMYINIDLRVIFLLMNKFMFKNFFD